MFCSCTDDIFSISVTYTTPIVDMTVDSSLAFCRKLNFSSMMFAYGASALYELFIARLCVEKPLFSLER